MNYYFAQSAGYGCQSYGATDSYNSCAVNGSETSAGTTETTTGTTTAGSSGGGSVAGKLQNTGASAFVPIVVAVVLIVAAIALFKKRKA